MKITTTISDEVVDKVIHGIMENFPEASSGNELRCSGWSYDDLKFDFVDSDENIYHVNKKDLLKAFKLAFTSKWPKGCTSLPLTNDWDIWDDWLCQSDAQDFDAFVQLACLGEVIYG